MSAEVLASIASNEAACKVRDAETEVEFADFQCPSCRQLARRLDATMKKFPTESAVEFRHYPLDIHPYAVAAALASECAADQNKFVEMHDQLFLSRDSIGVATWKGFVQRASVPDLDKCSRCMSDSLHIANVRRDRESAEELGARGTPTGLINGVRFTGSLPQNILDSLVSAAVQSGERR
jgi:protein-disulfide isomerase